MASDRFQRRIDRLSDQVEEAADQRDWERVRQLAEDVLTADPGNADAIKYLATVERGLSGSPRATRPAAFHPSPVSDQPTSFASGRYEVKRLAPSSAAAR